MSPATGVDGYGKDKIYCTLTGIRTQARPSHDVVWPLSKIQVQGLCCVPQKCQELEVTDSAERPTVTFFFKGLLIKRQCQVAHVFVRQDASTLRITLNSLILYLENLWTALVGG